MFTLENSLRHDMYDMLEKQEQGAVEEVFNKKLQYIKVVLGSLVDNLIPSSTKKKEFPKSKCTCLTEAEFEKRNIVASTNTRNQIDQSTAKVFSDREISMKAELWVLNL